jgi:hypothetical protein
LPSWFSSSLGFSPPSPPGNRHHPFRSRAPFTIRALASPNRDCTTAFSQTWKWRVLSRECQPFRGSFLVPPASSKTTSRWVMGSPPGPGPLPVRAPRPRATPSSARAKRDGLQDRHQATSVSQRDYILSPLVFLGRFLGADEPKPAQPDSSRLTAPDRSLQPIPRNDVRYPRAGPEAKTAA